jgi:phytol kinase
MHHGHHVTLLHEVSGLGMVTVLTLCVLALAELLKRTTPLPAELTRKLAHMGAGVSVLIIPLFIWSSWTVLAVTGGFGLLMLVTSRLGLLGSVHGVGRGVGGVLWYPFTAWLMYVLVFDVLHRSYVTYAIPVAVLGVADAMGAVVGKTYGRLSYRVTGSHQRSIEGSFAVFATAFLCVHVPLLLSNETGRAQTLLTSFSVALVAMMLETVSVHGLDNFLMPMGVLFVLEHERGMSVARLELQLAMLALLAAGVVATAWGRARAAGGTVALLLAAYAVWQLGGLAWLAPMAGLVLAFAAYERLSPVAGEHTRSRYGLGTATAALAMPLLVAAAASAVHSHRLHHALYDGYLASLACAAAVICFMLPQNHTFRFRRLRRAMATKDLWQYAPTTGKLALAVVGAALPAVLLPALAHVSVSAATISAAAAVWGVAGLAAFVAMASFTRSAHRTCPACGAVTLRGLHCCQDNYLGAGETRAALVTIDFRTTYLVANSIAALAAAAGVLWLT